MGTHDSPSPDDQVRVSVFVSYAHEDRPRAHQVVQGLEQAGFQVWWDGVIFAGTQFSIKTEEALASCSVVVVLWSQHSINSHWVRDEAGVGRDRARLVPVSLDGSEPPLGFRQYRFIDLSRWQGHSDAPEMDAVVSAVRQSAADTAPWSADMATFAAPPSTTRRGLLFAGAGLAALAVGAGGWFAWRRAAILAHPIGVGVAVLPFKNLSGDPGQAYFADGLSAELRGTLVRNPHLRVIAQVSSESFRASDLNAIGIADRLGVSYLLDGSVRRSGSMLRIAAELIDGRTGFSRWAQNFDRPIDNVFAVQTEIATAVALAFSAEIGQSAVGKSPDSVLITGGTTNVRAFDAYLRGRALYIQSDGEVQEREALVAFEVAIAADPNFAAAHSARARSLLVIANQYADAAHTTALYDAALDAARKGAALAPELADAQSTLAFVLFQGRLDVKGAREPYDLSCKFGAGDAAVLGRFALYCVYTKRQAEAMPAMEAAVRLDPLNPLVHRAMAEVSYAMRRYLEVLPHLDRALALNPKLPGARAARAYALYLLGRLTEARAQSLMETHKLERLPSLAVIERKLGNDGAARQAMAELVAELGDSALYQQAQVRTQWGERGAAMELLGRALAVGDSGLIFTNTDPLLDPIRDLPAFEELLRQLGFV